MVPDGSFICLGRHYPVEQLEYDAVLTDFDRLLPLYEFVVGDMAFPDPPARPSPTTCPLVPGHRPGKSATTLSRALGTIDVNLRHNVLSTQQWTELTAEYGSAAVQTEHPTSFQQCIDAVVETDGGRVLYEIKTDGSARACIRAALSQLLEYAYWPGTATPVAMVVVGEPPLDAASEEYLARLRGSLGLHISYRQLKVGQPATGD